MGGEKKSSSFRSFEMPHVSRRTLGDKVLSSRRSFLGSLSARGQPRFRF